MAYIKPGVEVQQVQESVSPNLIPPDLTACIVGPAYYVSEITDNPDSIWMFNYEPYDKDSGNTIVVSGLTDDMVLDQDSVYVDLIGGTTANAGIILHLDSTDFATSASGLAIDTAAASTNITDAFDGATIKIGYRARYTNKNTLMYIDSVDEIRSRLGVINTMNPLAYGLQAALLAANKTVFGFGVISSDDNTHAAALGYLGAKDVYVLTPLTHTDAVLTNYKEHVNYFSTPEQKKLRISVQNKSIAWTNSDDGDLGDYATGYAAALAGGYVGSTAQTLKANALSYGEKRIFWTFPDVSYVRERRHISTLKQSYLDYMYTNEQLGLNAILATNVTLASGTKYYAGEELTNALWTILAAEFSYLTVLIPVPGYYYACIVAGQISAYPPSQPFTNISIPVISRVKYTNDVFTETQLNTIAEGGNYIFVQSTDSSPIYCRHQLSTDMSTVERRELSITKTLDFVSKFIANGLLPYIGRYNISSAFLKLLSMTFSAQATYLVREGHVNGLTLEKIEQDVTQKDKVLVTMRVEVKYPVNYIRITLIF